MTTPVLTATGGVHGVHANPRIVLNAQTITSTLTSALGIAATLGVIPAVDGQAALTTSNLVVSAIFAVIGLVHVLVAHKSAQKVTPVVPGAVPTALDGTQLVPATAMVRIVPAEPAGNPQAAPLPVPVSAADVLAGLTPMPTPAAPAAPVA